MKIKKASDVLKCLHSHLEVTEYTQDFSYLRKCTLCVNLKIESCCNELLVVINSNTNNRLGSYKEKVGRNKK